MRNPIAKPLIPWIGGKRRLAASILRLLPEHTCYVELFAGGAAVLFARQQPAKVEVLNDLNGDLVSLYRVVQHHLDEFVRQFRWALTSREMFRWMQLQHIDCLTDIQRATRFFYLQKLSFGGKVVGQTFGVSQTSRNVINLLRIEEELSAAHLRLANVVIEHLPWQKCLERYDRPGTLFLADPPYWRCEGYGIPFAIEQHEQLASYMATIKGKLVLTINSHPDMKRVYGAFDGASEPIQYCVGGGTKQKPATEMIYRSWISAR